MMQNNPYGNVRVVKSLCDLGSTKTGIPNLNKVLKDVDLSTKHSIQVFNGKYLLMTDTPYERETCLDLDLLEDFTEAEGIDIFCEEPLKSIFYNEDWDCLHLRISLEEYNSLDESIKDKIDEFLEQNFSRAFLKYDSVNEAIVILGDMFLF